jgi:glycosyltransferase involved in cell wall biosynthesis
MFKKKKNAWIIAGHDGLTSCYTGVGVVVAEYLTELHRVFNDNQNVDILTFGPEIDPDSQIFNTELSTKTRLVSSFRSYKPIKGNKTGPQVWGGVIEWRSASRHLADFVKELSHKYENINVIAHDTIFLQARHLLSKADCKNVNFFFVPHSLSFIFQDNFSDQERENFELQGLSALTQNDYVVTLSPHVRKIIDSLGLENKIQCLDCYNGIPSHESPLLPEEAERILSNPITFTFLFIGRATEQKGVLSFLQQLEKVILQNNNYSFVGFLPAETDEVKYLEEVKAEVEKLNFVETFISSEFNFGVSKLAYASIQNGCVVFNSRYETAPITPLEAIRYCRSDIPILYSNIDAHKDLFTSIPNCYVIDEQLKENIHKKNKDIRTLPEKYSFKLSVRKIIESV